MIKNLTNQHNGRIVAQKIADARYVHSVSMLSEASNRRDDQIAFSYPFYRIVTCYSGNAEFAVVKDKQPGMVGLEPGDTVIITPGACVRSINQKPYKTCGILLRDQSMDLFTNDHHCRHRHRFMTPIRYVRQDLHVLFKQSTAFSDNPELSVQYAMLIWTHVSEIIKKQNQPSGSHGTFLKLKSYVGKHFAFGINRKIVAKELGLNPDYLNALFHQFTGLGFTEYIMKIKLEEARNILQDKRLSIAQVARLCGFNSNTYFGRRFKCHYGMTPMAFRKTLDETVSADPKGLAHAQESRKQPLTDSGLLFLK